MSNNCYNTNPYDTSFATASAISGPYTKGSAPFKDTATLPQETLVLFFRCTKFFNIANPATHRSVFMFSTEHSVPIHWSVECISLRSTGVWRHEAIVPVLFHAPKIEYCPLGKYLTKVTLHIQHPTGLRSISRWSS